MPPSISKIRSAISFFFISGLSRSVSNRDALSVPDVRLQPPRSVTCHYPVKPTRKKPDKPPPRPPNRCNVSRKNGHLHLCDLEAGDGEGFSDLLPSFES